MNSSQTSSSAHSVFGAVLGAIVFTGLALCVRYLLALPPALVWLAVTFGLSGALVGYLGMRHVQGLICASIGMVVCTLVGAIVGDQVGGLIPVNEQGIATEGQLLRIDGPTLDGGSFNVEQWRGKVVLVDFWATWCGPCLAELPNVKRVYNRFHDRGFEIVGVSLDGDRDRLTEFLKQREIPWPQIFFSEPGQQEWNNPLVQRYDITGIPTMYLLDRSGRVAPVEPRGAELAPAVEKLLAGGSAGEPGGDRDVHVGLFRMGLLIGAWIGALAGIWIGDSFERFLRNRRKPAGVV
jgi:thiol-disulfide isomerase/thioredoxin